MNKHRNKKILFDIAILITCCIWGAAAYMLKLTGRIIFISLGVVFFLVVFALFDLIKQGKQKKSSYRLKGNQTKAFELILLDEQDRPIKTWSLVGRTSLIIGRKHKDEEVDVDLSDCEYSSFIDIQHAVVNYCMDSWYLEDLDSKNGVKIKKIEDNVCYRINQSRPCRLKPGDVIYIASTRILFT